MPHSRGVDPTARRRRESQGERHRSQRIRSDRSDRSDRSEQQATAGSAATGDLGRAGRRRGLARLHPDGGLRRERAPGDRAGRGPGADRRRRPPLPRCDLVALGEHARPPRPRARMRPSPPRPPRSPTRPCWATATRSWSSWPRRWPVWSRWTTRTSSSPPTVRWRSSRPSRSRSSTGSTGASRAARGFLALGDAYHGDTIGSLSLGDGGVFSAVFEPLCFPVMRTPGYADPGWADKACATIEAHAGELAAVVLEPLVQGASGMLWPPRPMCGGSARRAARPGVLAGLRRGGDRVRADRDAVRLRAVRAAARPALPRQGDHRRVPRHVGHGGVGRGVRCVPRRRPRAVDLLPRALLRRERPRRRRGARAPAPHRVLGRARQRACPGRAAGGPPR